MCARAAAILKILCLLAVPALLAGCSGMPTEGRARSDLQKWFDYRWPGTIAVEEYRTTKAEGDGSGCVIYYRAKARFLKDTEGCVSTCCGDVCFDRLISGFRWLAKKADNPHIVQRGDLFEVEWRHTYRKAWHGWINKDLPEGS